jgi:hypothetical protein
MKDLELALEDCLQELATGKSSITRCLKRYPDLAAELRPMLEAALRLQQGRDLRPSRAFRDRTRAELAEQMASQSRGRSKKGHPITGFALTLLTVALAFGVSTVYAQAALPGQSLYPWKLSSERAWRVASSDPLSFDLGLADRRTEELITVCHNHEPDADGITAYTEVLDRLTTETAASDGARVMRELQAHQQQLLQAGIHVPELDDIVVRLKSLRGQLPKAPKP